MNNINEELYRAITYGTTEKVKDILNMGADPNYNIRGTPPLFLALYQNKMDVFEILLNHPEIDINIQNSLGNTILVECMSENLDIIIDKIFKKDVFLFTPNEKGDYPIHFAIMYKKEDLVNKILSDHPKYIDIRNSIGNTPLILASITGNENLIKNILKYNPKIDLKNRFDKDALYYLKLKNLTHLINNIDESNDIDNNIIKKSEKENELNDILEIPKALSNIKKKRDK